MVLLGLCGQGLLGAGRERPRLRSAEGSEIGRDGSGPDRSRVLASIRALPTLPRFIHGAKTVLCLLTFMTVIRRKVRGRMTLDRQKSHSGSPNKSHGVAESEKEQQNGPPFCCRKPRRLHPPCRRQPICSARRTAFIASIVSATGRSRRRRRSLLSRHLCTSRERHPCLSEFWPD
jgi:hypothetical protein